MADSGPESLRKQIAFLSNLIKLHKASELKGCHEIGTVAKSRPNKSWSRWKSDSELQKSKSYWDVNENMNEGRHIAAVKGDLSRTVSNTQNMKTTFSLKSRQGPPHRGSVHLSNSTSYNSRTVGNTSSYESDKIEHGLVRPIRTNFQTSPLREVPHPSMKYKLNTKLRSSQSLSANICAPNLGTSKGLPKTATSTSYLDIKKPSACSSTASKRSLLREQTPVSSSQSMNSLQTSKTKTNFSKLLGRSQSTERSQLALVPNINILTENPSTKSERYVRPPSKTIHGLIGFNTHHAQHQPSSNTLPKTISRTSFNIAAKSTAVPRQSAAQPRAAAVSRGSKLKWRRKSFNRAKNITIKTRPVCKTNLKLRTGGKSKWRNGRFGSTLSSGRRTTPGSFTKSSHGSSRIMQKMGQGLSTQIPKRSGLEGKLSSRAKLKWKKSAFHGTLVAKDNKFVATKTDRIFSRNSRFSLKRRKSSEGKTLGMNKGFLGGSRRQQWSGPVSRFKSQNRGFIARRMKFIATGLNKQSDTRNVPLRRVTIGGSYYVISSHGRTLKRTVASHGNKRKFSNVKRQSSLRVYRKPSVPSSTSSFSRIFNRQQSVDKCKTQKANKILKRTLHNVQAVMRRSKKLKSNEYCMFYNKFGKCSKQKEGKCPYIHDPTKIAVCTRFLRGTCQRMDGTCPFSHRIDKEKMPICQYFMKGKCYKENCPYSHVNVGRQAVVCEDFLKGYCALGFKCKKKHVLECEEFARKGECQKGKKCKLIHRKKIVSQKRYFEEDSSVEVEGEGSHAKKIRRRSSDGFLPLAVSSLGDEELQSVKKADIVKGGRESNTWLRIRPHFSTRQNGQMLT